MVRETSDNRLNVWVDYWFYWLKKREVTKIANTKGFCNISETLLKITLNVTYILMELKMNCLIPTNHLIQLLLHSKFQKCKKLVEDPIKLRQFRH